MTEIIIIGSKKSDNRSKGNFMSSFKVKSLDDSWEVGGERTTNEFGAGKQKDLRHMKKESSGKDKSIEKWFILLWEEQC